MTEQTTWLQAYGWAAAAAVIVIFAAALLLVIGKRRMTTKQNHSHQQGKGGNEALALDCIARENDFLEAHRGELLTSLRTSAQRERLRSVDLRISACWFSADGIQGLLDAMTNAIGESLAAGDDAQTIRMNIVNPYIIPARVRLHGLRRALDEAREDCYPIPDDADLRLFLQLAPIRAADGTQTILQKSTENRRLIEQCLRAHGYDVHYDGLLAALLDVLDGEASHAFDEGNQPDAHGCAAALTAIAEGMKKLRAEWSRP